jgi:hypothetical protein
MRRIAVTDGSVSANHNITQMSSNADYIVTRLRADGVYGPTDKTLPLSREAADEIERLRAAGDALLDRLNDWHNGAPYDLDAEAIKAWEEARRD